MSTLRNNHWNHPENACHQTQRASRALLGSRHPAPRRVQFHAHPVAEGHQKHCSCSLVTLPRQVLTVGRLSDQHLSGCRELHRAWLKQKRTCHIELVLRNVLFSCSITARGLYNYYPITQENAKPIIFQLANLPQWWAHLLCLYMGGFKNPQRMSLYLWSVLLLGRIVIFFPNL